jgi:hypothetical protein
MLDEAPGELGSAYRNRLVVIVFDGELVVLAANVDAALAVDLANGELVALLDRGAVKRLLAGQGDGRAEHDDVLGAGRLRATYAAKQRSCQACRQQSRWPHVSIPRR